MGLGLIFHHFTGHGHPHIQGALTAEDFDRFIMSAGVHKLLSPEAWIAALLSGRIKANQHCLTFDDALASQIDVALPVLESHGIKAFFFIYSSVLEGKLELFEIYRYFKNLFYPGIDNFYGDFYPALRETLGEGFDYDRLASDEAGAYLQQYDFYSEADRRFRFARDRLLSAKDYNAIMCTLMARRGTSPAAIGQNIWIGKSGVERILKDGHLIGLHSHTHPTNMSVLPRQQQLDEYVQNMELMSKLLGYRPDTMAHPSGSYNDDTLDILRSLGVRIGFRSDDDVGRGSLLELPRLDYQLYAERWMPRTSLSTASGLA